MDPEGEERITAARRPQPPARRTKHGQSRGRIPYEAPLDGLRGVSVLAVLFYHAELSWAPGGFLGVEAFFVLSGYLITTLLLTEWRQTGSIDLVAFWGRRARRLLPALFALLAAIAVYAALIASPSELGQIRGDALSTLAYINNWWQILAGHSYFDQFETPSPPASCVVTRHRGAVVRRLAVDRHARDAPVPKRKNATGPLVDSGGGVCPGHGPPV